VGVAIAVFGPGPKWHVAQLYSCGREQKSKISLQIPNIFIFELLLITGELRVAWQQNRRGWQGTCLLTLVSLVVTEKGIFEYLSTVAARAHSQHQWKFKFRY
jgi:hypothetical protein